MEENCGYIDDDEPGLHMLVTFSLSALVVAAVGDIGVAVRLPGSRLAPFTIRRAGRVSDICLQPAAGDPVSR